MPSKEDHEETRKASNRSLSGTKPTRAERAERGQQLYPSDEGIQSFGRALRSAREAHPSRPSQGEIAAHLGYSQTSVAGWEIGANVPQYPQQVFEIERYLDLVPGTLSGHLGYVPAPVDGTQETITESNRQFVSQIIQRLRGANSLAPDDRRVLIGMLTRMLD